VHSRAPGDTIRALMTAISRTLLLTARRLHAGLHYALISSILCAAGALNASAQTTVSGKVTDPIGGAVTGATVTLSRPGGAPPHTATTDQDGSFSISDVRPASYVVAVEAPGFQRWTRSVDTTSSPTLDIVLPVPGFSESVAVTARRLEEELPQEIERTGVRVQTITATQIENGGYYDTGQALQALVPGLFLMPRSGPFDYVDASLQGSRTNEVLWLVDGVRISNRLYNGTTPLDTIPAHMIERIEVIEGGQGLFYGTQAVAGAVNVVTKSFADTSNGRVQSGFDTNEGRHVNLFARDSFGGHKFVFYGSSDKADGYQNFPASQYQASATDRRRSYDVIMLGGKYAYDFSNGLRLSAGYQRSDVTLDNLRPGRSGAAHVGGLAAGFNARAEHVFNAKVDYTARQHAQLFFKTYYHQWDSNFTERRNVAGSPGTVRISSDADFWGFKDYGANLLAKLTPHRGYEYFAGYDFQNYRGRDQVLLIAPNTETVHALFGQVRTTRDLFQKATFALGARFNAPTNAGNASVWNASSQYDVTPRMFVRGTVGTAFRYPDAYELFAVDPDCCYGNLALKPERSTNSNGSVGYRASLGEVDLTVEAIGFYRRVTDLIVDVDGGGPGGNSITANRPDVVRVRGVSFVATSTVTPEASASVSYTHNSQRTNELAGGYSALTGIPSNQLNASFDLHPTDVPVGFTLAVNHVGRLTNSVPVFGAVAAGDFTIVDLSGRLFLDSRKRHRINVRVENVFDEVYTTRNSRNFLDSAPTPYLVSALGMPRTLHVSYSVGF
jgi:outer membrane cobalamin receptor